MSKIHEHYDQLTDAEREWVDEVFSDLMERSGGFTVAERPQLANDDRAERAVDGVARWIIESRDLT